MSDNGAIVAARAMLRSGLLKPTSPATLVRVARATARGPANLATALAIATARWPDRTVIIDDAGQLSYSELHSRTASLAAALARNEVGPGNAVAVMCRNGRSFLQSVFAAAWVGADVVLLNTEFGAAALADALVAHHIDIVLCEREFAALVNEADAAVTIDPTTVSADDAAVSPKVGPPGRVVLLTSGTTGKPKGVPRTFGTASAVVAGLAFLDRLGLRVGSRIVVPVPMFHSLGFGMANLAVTLGGTVLTSRYFDPEATLASVATHRAQALAAVPVMLARILDLPEGVRARYPLPALRVVMCAGARLEPSLARRFVDVYGDVLYNGYGSSEVGIGAIATPAELRDTPETVGKPLPGCPVTILDRDRKPVGPGVVGRIFVGGAMTFEGYTAGGSKDVVAGMMDTGDMGYLDTAGRLYIVGRDDDMIVSGGENVYPRAVENALGEHPDVADHTVVGVPDQDFGQRLVAFVVARPGAHLDEAELRKYLKERVSRFEQPRDITVVGEIPRNPTGKVLRTKLPI